MNTQRGFTLMELMIVIAIAGICFVALNVTSTSTPKPVMKDQMRGFVNSLYQPKDEVRISCTGRQCTAVFTDRQEREKTVVANCGTDGCVAVVPKER